jgi:hypothetical protein
VGITKAGGAETPQVQFSTDHRFARNSHLRFITFIYNAALSQDGKSQPNIWLQARLLRGGQIVKSTPMKNVPVEKQDILRIPFGGEISLDSVPSGQYVLEIIVDDQIAKTTVTQRTKITVE